MRQEYAGVSAHVHCDIARGAVITVRDDLVYSVNEWDNYAVEEAIQIVEREGGSLTVVSAGDPEAEEIVHREMAMGANHGLLLTDDAFTASDGRWLFRDLLPLAWAQTVAIFASGMVSCERRSL